MKNHVDSPTGSMAPSKRASTISDDGRTVLAATEGEPSPPVGLTWFLSKTSLAFGTEYFRISSSSFGPQPPKSSAMKRPAGRNRCGERISMKAHDAGMRQGMRRGRETSTGHLSQTQRLRQTAPNYSAQPGGESTNPNLRSRRAQTLHCLGLSVSRVGRCQTVRAKKDTALLLHGPSIIVGRRTESIRREPSQPGIPAAFERCRLHSCG